VCTSERLEAWLTAESASWYGNRRLLSKAKN
jgi:hypothetical protein